MPDRGVSSRELGAPRRLFRAPAYLHFVGLSDADIADLKTARSNAIARLKEATASPKPTYDVDGQSFSWNEYQRMLLEIVERSNRLLVDEEEDPFVVETQIYTDPPYGAFRQR